MAFFERHVPDDISKSMGAPMCPAERCVGGVVRRETPCAVQEQGGVNRPYFMSFVRDVSERDVFFRFQPVRELRESSDAHVKIVIIMLFFTQRVVPKFMCLQKRTPRKKKYRLGMIKKDSLEKKMESINNFLKKTGEVVGNAVDGIGSGFTAVVDSFASVSTFSNKKSKFGGQLPSTKGPMPTQTFTAQLPSNEYKQGFTAEEDPEVKRQREAAFRKAAAEAEALNWSGRDWEHRRRETWSGQAEKNLPGGGPVTYQQAILAQPMPVLSPLRGSNSPQGVRAIVDASVGTTTASFNPALGTPGVAIPSNATAGSLDASIKVNVINNGAAPVKSSFAAMFD
jgi:hypothetical protein